MTRHRRKRKAGAGFFMGLVLAAFVLVTGSAVVAFGLRFF